MKKTIIIKTFLFLSALVVASPAWAVDVPPSAQPGQVERRFEQREIPRSELEAVSPESEAQNVPAGADAAIFTLQGVAFEGQTVYSEDELRPYYENLIGQEIALSQVFKMAETINAKYRNDGYILTRVVVPPQKIQGGVVRLKVVEGFIEDVTVEGDVEGTNFNFIEAYVEDFLGTRPARTQDIERLLLLINELPGVVAESVLRRSPDQVGGAVLAILVSHDTFEFYATADNRGTRYVGPLQVTVGAEANSLLGLYDQFRLRFITTDEEQELKLGEFNYNQPIGPWGTVLKLTAVKSDIEPGFDLESSEVESKSIRYTAEIEHPLIRTRSENWFLTGEFTYRNSKTDVLGTLITRDRIRAARLSTSYDWVDTWLGVNLFGASFSQGLDILDATETGSANLSRAAGHSDFSKFNMNFSRLQRITSDLSLLASLNGQFAFDQLLSSEQFSLGGAEFGRGYDPSEVTGDHGLAGLVELRYDVYSGEEYFTDFQFYGSYDLGAVWQIDNNNNDNRTSLASLATGVRFNVTDAISGQFEAALPLTKKVSTRAEDGDEWRGFFSLTARF